MVAHLPPPRARSLRKSNRRLQPTRIVVDRMKQIFFQRLQGGGNSFSRTRGVWRYVRVRATTIPFYETIANTGGFAESLGQIELQRTGLPPVCAADFSARVRAYIPRDRLRTRELLVANRVFDNTQNQSKNSRSFRLLFFLRLFFIFSSFLHYRIDAIWNSISHNVFSMNNIGSLTLFLSFSLYRSRADCTIATRIIERRTLRYWKLLIPLLGRRYGIDL